MFIKSILCERAKTASGESGFRGDSPATCTLISYIALSDGYETGPVGTSSSAEHPARAGTIRRSRYAKVLRNTGCGGLVLRNTDVRVNVRCE